jgi:hypothetical protein
MGNRGKIVLLLVTISIVYFSSCKKSKRYLPPLNYVKNMEGMHYWQGTFIDTDLSVFPPKIVSINIKENFGILVLNDSTISYDDIHSFIYQYSNNGYHYDTFIVTSTDITANTITFSNNFSLVKHNMIYNYVNNSMIENDKENVGGPHGLHAYRVLHTP